MILDYYDDLNESLIIPILGIIPVEPLFIKLDNDLGDFHIGLLSRHQVCLVRTWEKNAKLHGCASDSTHPST